MSALTEPWCLDCVHYDYKLDACLFTLDTGRSRAFGPAPCKAGRDCIHHRRGQRLCSGAGRADDSSRVELWKQGKTDREIADICGTEPKAIASWRSHRGLAVNKAPPKPKGAYPERERLYAEGKVDAEIARRLGISLSAISWWRTSRGYPPNGRPGGGRERRG